MRAISPEQLSKILRNWAEYSKWSSWALTVRRYLLSLLCKDRRWVFFRQETGTQWVDLKGSVGFETGKKKSASDSERDTLLCCLDLSYPTGSNCYSISTQQLYTSLNCICNCFILLSRCCITVSCICSFSFFISGNGKSETRQLFDTSLFLTPYIQSFTCSLSLKYFFNWFTFLILTSNIQVQATIISCLDYCSALLPHFLVFIFLLKVHFQILAQLIV